MRSALRTILLLISLAYVMQVSAQELLTHEAFTEAVKREIQKKAPTLKVRAVNAMHLEAENSEGEKSQLFLDNAYAKYRDSPETKADIIAAHISLLLDSPIFDSKPVDFSKVVPVIKHVSFGNENQKLLLHDSYNAELLIFYAEDTDATIRYLQKTDLKGNNFIKPNRLAKAIHNLRPLLKQIEINSAKGVYLITGNSGYEASLLLLDDFWLSGQFNVQGDLVVAVPSRSVLVVTGSENIDGLQTMSRITSRATSKNAYLISEKPFIRRNGRFVPFNF